MDFLINGSEIAAMSGLSHLQQLTYLRGIRPYMDVTTGTTGVKRRISYQSIAEQLYVEPSQGIKSQNFSRDQIRRAIFGLVRAGLISVQSEGMQLILKCELATQDYFVQNKAAINPPQQPAIFVASEHLDNTSSYEEKVEKADIDKPPKAATPLIKDNYLYFLLQQFEKFWSLYPEKKSREKTWQKFQLLNPDEKLFSQIMIALDAQIKNREQKLLMDTWVPSWKYPANWLAERCFEDEITEPKLERKNATHRDNHNNQSAKDPFWCPEEECNITNNILQFKRK